MGTPNHAFSDHIISKITDLAFIQNQHWVSTSGTGEHKSQQETVSIPSCNLIHAPSLILNPKALAFKYLLRWIKCPPWKCNKGPSLLAVIEAKEINQVVHHTSCVPLWKDLWEANTPVQVDYENNFRLDYKEQGTRQAIEGWKLRHWKKGCDSCTTRRSKSDKKNLRSPLSFYDAGRRENGETTQYWPTSTIRVS